MINSAGERVPLFGQPETWFAWLTGPDEALAHKAQLILGGLEPSDPVAVEELARHLDADDEHVQFWALVALARLEGRAVPTLGRITELAQSHAAFGLRQMAVMALPRIAPADHRTKATLLLAFEDENPFVRREALQAFIKVSDPTPEDLARLARCEGDPDATVARWAEIALRNIRRRSEARDRAV